MSDRPLTILVVDDEPEIAQLCVDDFALSGHVVIALSCAVNPWRLYFGNGPDVILLDIMLQGPYSGISMARVLREERKLQIPLIAFSADPDMVRKALDTGLFAAALEKPFDLVQLTLAIRAAVGDEVAA